MNKKVITISIFDADSIDKAIKEVNEYRKWLKKCTEKFIEELANEGLKTTQANFLKADYDGTNDVSVHVEKRDEHTTAVVAVGASVLFIEFGTGITYPDNHPEAGENGMIRGGYGYHLGNLKNGWRYQGDPGTNGQVITSGSHAGMVHTYGNPANMSMYNAVRDLEQKFTEIAQRCFV